MMFSRRFSDHDLQRLITKCRSLPLVSGEFLVQDYVENLLLTVLDFQMRGTTVGRAMDHFSQHAQKDVSDFDGLQRLLASYPDTREGNRQMAQYLWGYNLWTRAEMLRRLVTYFEACGVTTPEQLQQWASRADFARDFKGQVKGAGFAVFQWLVMRQGIETVKPDIWIHRFIRDVLGHSVRDETAVELLETVALELGIKAYELDWRIWEYQSGRK